MLKTLSISNYALIDKAEIDFGPGLSIITGETGAGKSIMLGALSLLLGSRADSRIVARGQKKAVVEATFTSPPQRLRKAVEGAGAEWDADILIIRRELSAGGRSRAFVNDSPVTLQVIQAITPALVDIHSQHNNLLLADPMARLSIVDAMAGNNALLNDYRSAFRQYVALRHSLEERRAELARNRENREFMLFRLEQLDKLKPRRGELEELEREYDLLSDAGEIKESIAMASSLLSDPERSALALLSEARGALGRVNLSLFEPESDTAAGGIRQRIGSLYIELKDIASTIEGYASEIEDNPARLQRVSARIDAINEALRRFKVNDEDQLVELHDKMRHELAGSAESDTEIAEMQSQLTCLGRSLKEKAERLSATRRDAADTLSVKLMESASALGMPNLKFSIVVNRGKLHSEGMDSVEFLCSFNKNQELMPLERVASGGETSRLMLSLKAILSGRLNIPTVIFDEIDTGVSGEIADRMGTMMKRMGADVQVLAITHLPQVASKGTRHYRVFKSDVADATLTHIKILTEEERVLELAKMLSGDHVDDPALANARSLLGKSKQQDE